MPIPSTYPPESSARMESQPARNPNAVGRRAGQTLRASREDRTAVIEPPLAQVGQTIAGNQELRAGYHGEIAGQSIGKLADEARRELIEEALTWTRSYRDVPTPPSEGTLLMAGHQPQLFHPGVWFKNFVLAHLACEHRATPVNLLIDSDVPKSAGLRVPGGSVDEPRVEFLAFDEPMPGVPYEERAVRDRRLFDDFGQRVCRQIHPLVSDPLMREFWPTVIRRADETGKLGAAIAQSRHQLEGRWGVKTLEVPQSRVCDTPSFVRFAVHLLAELPRLAGVYNEAMRQYRHAHRIRNAAQPAPNLAVEGSWHEAPFWVWTPDNPHRRRFFVQRQRTDLAVTDRAGLAFELPLTDDGPFEPAIERLVELGRQGVKIRSRALITTLWARLVLGDLFLHGIGGAAYDQVTDVLMERFFRVRPPEYLVVSGTLCLPVSRPNVSRDDARTIERQLRELTYHPEEYLPAASTDDGAASAEFVSAKRRWIATPQTRDNARTRCRSIRALNERLRPFVAGQRERLFELRRETAHALHVQEVLSSRDYAFCLFPETTLRDFLVGLLPKLRETCFDT